MKKVLFFFLMVLSTASVFGQNTDFSGNWKLNSSKSKLNTEFSMAPKEIIIVYSGNDLNIEKHSSFQDQDFTTKDKLTVDGKECINPGWQDSQKKSTVVLSEDKKSLKITTKFPMNDGGEVLITEIYKMDGTNMVIESSASSSYGDMAESMVYDKQ